MRSVSTVENNLESVFLLPDLLSVCLCSGCLVHDPDMPSCSHHALNWHCSLSKLRLSVVEHETTGTWWPGLATACQPLLGSRLCLSACPTPTSSVERLRVRLSGHPTDGCEFRMDWCGETQWRMCGCTASATPGQRGWIIPWLAMAKLMNQWQYGKVLVSTSQLTAEV